jgi:ubiquitin-like domain-containing CTD phosphatase 1
MDSAASNTSSILLSDVLVGPTDTTITSQGSTSEAGTGLGLATLETENWVSLRFTHSGKEYTVDLADSDRYVYSRLWPLQQFGLNWCSVFDLKAALESLTGVPQERQKIIGLVKGKLPPDQATIRQLNLVSGKKFTLIGTPQGHEHKDPTQLDLPDVFNDLDIDFSADPNSEAVLKFKNDLRNKRKIKEAVEALNVNLMNPLREGKKLLVLDLDYSESPSFIFFPCAYSDI